MNWEASTIVLYVLGFVLCLGTLRRIPPVNPRYWQDLLAALVWPAAVINAVVRVAFHAAFGRSG